MLAPASPEGSKKLTLCSVIPSACPIVDALPNLQGANGANWAGHVQTKSRVTTSKPIQKRIVFNLLGCSHQLYSDFDAAWILPLIICSSTPACVFRGLRAGPLARLPGP